MTLYTRQIGRKSLLNLFVKLSVSLFGLITLTALKRSPDFGYEAVGIVAFAFSFASIFKIVGDMGIGAAHIKLSNEKNLNQAKCNGTLVSIKLFLTLILGILLFGLVTLSSFSFETKLAEVVIYLTIVIFLINNLISIMSNLFSAKLEVAKAWFPRFWLRFIQMASKLFIILFTSYGLAYVVGIEIFSGMLILLSMLYLSRDYSFAKPDWEYIRMYYKFAFPLILVGLVASLNENFDKLMLQYFEGSFEVGVYSLPQRLLTVLLIVPTIVVNLLLPIFSKEFSQKNYTKIHNLSDKATKYICLFMVPLCIFTYLFSNEIMTLAFGSDAIKSAPILRVLVVGIFFHTLSFPYSIQIISTGHAWLGSAISVFALLINIIFNLIFIPESIFGIPMLGLGTLGASLATIISLILRAIVIVFCVYRITQTRVYNNIWKHLLAGLFLISLNGLITDIYTPYFLPLLFLLITGAYFSILYILREVGPSEIKYIADVFNIRKMLKYIKRELSNRGE